MAMFSLSSPNRCEYNIPSYIFRGFGSFTNSISCSKVGHGDDSCTQCSNALNTATVMLSTQQHGMSNGSTLHLDT